MNRHNSSEMRSSRLARLSRWGLALLALPPLLLTANASGLAGITLHFAREHWWAHLFPLVLSVFLLRRLVQKLTGGWEALAVVGLSVAEACLHSVTAEKWPTWALVQQAVMAGALTAFATWRWPKR